MSLIDRQLSEPTRTWTQPTGNAAVDVADRELPSRIGRFWIVGELGSGGMGRVLTGWDPQLRRRVAVKVLRAVRTSALDRVRFRREALALARLSHPNVVSIFDVGEHDGAPYVAMERVDGQTLRAWLEEHPLGQRPTDRVLKLLLQAARGLSAAHGAGIVHRDFKPSNVLVGDDGRVRVADFGLAQSLEEKGSTGSVASPARADHTDATRTGTVVGTPRYMAPEQLRGGAIDPRTDQYAFCLVAWEALTGALPDARRSNAPGLDRRIRAALRQGLSTQAERRFPTMAALIDRLERARRWRTPLGVGLVAALLGASAIGEVSPAATEAELACADLRTAERGLWSAERRATIETKLREAGASTRFDRLDASLGRWIEELERPLATACDLAAAEKEANALRGCLRDKLALVEQSIALLERTEGTDVHASTRFIERLPSTECEPSGLGLDERGELTNTLALGIALRVAGRYVEAVEVLEPLRARATALDSASVLANANYEIAVCENNLQHPERARSFAEESFVQASRLDDRSLAASAANHLAGIAIVLSDLDAAEHWLNTAEAWRNRLPHDARLEAEILETQGDLAEALGEPERAIELFEQSEGAYRSGGHDCASLWPRLDRGSLLTNLGRFEDAKTTLTELPSRAEACYGPDHHLRLVIFNTFGALYVKTGDESGAQQAFETAHAIALELYGPDSLPTMKMKYNLLMEVVQGLPYPERWTRTEAFLAEVRGSAAEEQLLPSLLLDVGTTAKLAGKFERALDLMFEANAMFERTGNQRAVALTLHQIGATYMGWLRGRDALPYLQRALTIHESRGERYSSAKTEYDIGQTYAVLEDYPTAALWLNKARTHLAATQGDSHPEVARFMITEAEILALAGRSEEARAHLDQAIGMLGDGPRDRLSAARASFTLGKLEWRTNRPAATKRIREALAVHEGAGDALQAAEIRAWMREHGLRTTSGSPE